MAPAPNAETLANSVAERVRLDIIAAGLNEGALLGTEAALADRYGVSRNIAREAVSRLRALGILVSRQGKGLLVGRADPVGLLSRCLPFHRRDPADLRHLAQWRYVLEIGAIDLAVPQATMAQVDQLAALAAEYERLGSRQHSDREENAVELAFHSLILQMTDNPLIAGMHDLLMSYFASSTHPGDVADPDRARTVWQHHAIADAIRHRDLEQARALLRQHLQHMPDIRQALAPPQGEVTPGPADSIATAAAGAPRAPGAMEGLPQ